MPANVTNSAAVDKGNTPDTKVKVEDAVVAKAPDGKEVDFKKLSVQEALDTLKVPGPLFCQIYGLCKVVQSVSSAFTIVAAKGSQYKFMLCRLLPTG